MAAYDNVAMPGAPGAMSYGAGLVNFAPLGDLADSYFKGQKEQRSESVAKAFKDGIPTGQDGQPDYNAMAAKLFQLGDFGGGTSLANTGINRSQLENASKLANQGTQLSGLPGQAGATQPPPQAPGQSFAAPPPTAAVSGGSPTGYNGGDNGQNTVASVVMAKMPPELAGPAINRIAGRLGIDPNQPLSQDQMAKVGAGLLAEGQGTPTGGPVPGAPPQAMAQAAPQDQGTTQPAPGLQQAIAAGEKRAAGMTPEQRINWLNRVATAPLGPYGKALNEWAAERLKAEYAAVAPTTEQKNIGSGATARGLEIDNEVKQSQKTYNGMQAASTQFERDMKPYLDLSSSILNRPEMYSGTGANLALNINKVRAALGDQKAAVLQEALQKVTAVSVLGQINQQRDQLMEAGGTSGRIFSQQVGLVEKAAPALSNTVYGNRFLVNVSRRVGDFTTQVAQQARDYIREHGHLDPKFDQQIADFTRSSPIFSKQELDDPRILGAPDAPATIKNQQQAGAWATSMGLQSGDPFRTPGGQIKYVP